MPTLSQELVDRAYVCIDAAHFGRISASTAREYRLVADRIQAARVAAGPDWQGAKSIAASAAYQTVCRAAWARRTHLEVAAALRDLRDQLASPEDIGARLSSWVPEAESCPPVAFRYDPTALARRPGRPTRIEQPKRSKKFGMRELPPGWMGRLWEQAVSADSRHLDALAVTVATGCRPVEIVHGVVLRRVDGGLEATITGAKVAGSAGQPWRKLTVTADHDGPVAHLLGLADADGGQAIVRLTATPAAFSMALTALGERLGVERRISPYDVRHRRAADARLAFGHDLQRVAAWLGHSGEETVRYYGRASGGGGVAGARPIDAVAAHVVRHRERTSAVQPDQAAGPA